MQLSLAIAALAITTAHAFLPENRDCGDMKICLTSFRWCEIANDVATDDCYYPFGVYPQDPERREPRQTEGLAPTLIWNQIYRIEWRTTQSEAVTIRWIMMDSYKEGNATEGVAKNVRWETSEYSHAIAISCKCVLTPRCRCYESRYQLLYFQSECYNVSESALPERHL